MLIKGHDTKELTLLLLKSIRGTQSLEALARKLDLTKTQIHRWESGKTDIRWDNFVEICRARKINLNSAIKIALKRPVSPLNTKKLMHDFLKEDLDADVLRYINASKSSIKRWESGTSFPTLIQLLLILNLENKHFFIRFAKELRFSDDKLVFPRNHQIFKGTSNLKGVPPLGLAILQFLKLESIRSKKYVKGKIAKQLGITKAQEEQSLKALENDGVISSSSSGKIEILKPINLLELTPKERRELEDYWIKFKLNRKGHKQDKAGFLITSATEESLNKIEEARKEYHTKIRKVLLDQTEENREHILFISMDNLKLNP